MPQQVEIGASSDVSATFGVAKYHMSLQSDLLQLQAMDATGAVLTTIELRGKNLDQATDLKSILRDPFGAVHGNASHSRANGRWGNVENDPGKDPVASLPQGSADMRRELEAYARDLAQQAHGTPATGRFQPHAMIDGICFIAGVGTGFWPIGTLIFGPTAVGCAVYYFMH